MSNTNDFGLLIVDIQGKLARMVENSEQFILNTQKLIQCSKALSIPIIALEQNPNGLGKTVPEIASMLQDVTMYEKHHFNAVAEDKIYQAISQTQKTHWLLAGIEAHICVYQTTLGLMAKGFQTHVVSDCVASRSQANIDLALANLRHQGANITSLEMCMFELMEHCQHPAFRQVLKTIK